MGRKNEIAENGGRTTADAITEDDGRTIADMSNVESPSVLGSWFGWRGPDTAGRPGGRGESSRSRRSSSSAPQAGQLDKEERRAAIRGALGASLLVGFVYLAAFAVLIALMVWLLR